MSAHGGAFLLSYYHHRKTDVDALVEQCATTPRLIADSGAFSAFTMGATITCDEYAEWAHRWAHRFDAFFNLDVIGRSVDPMASVEGSRENHRRLHELGVDTVQVWHLGEPVSVLREYLAEADYVAVGGMVNSPFDKRQQLRRCAQAHKEARAAGGKRLHGLGQSTAQQLQLLPWATVDSSSWGAGFRYGQVRLWDHRQARLVDVKVGQADAHRWGDLLRAAGSDPRLISDRDLYSYQEAAAVAAWSYHQMELWLRRRWGNDDFVLYLAEGSPPNIVSASHGIARGKELA